MVNDRIQIHAVVINLVDKHALNLLQQQLLRQYALQMVHLKREYVALLRIRIDVPHGGELAHRVEHRARHGDGGAQARRSVGKLTLGASRCLEDASYVGVHKLHSTKGDIQIESGNASRERACKHCFARS